MSDGTAAGTTGNASGARIRMDDGGSILSGGLQLHLGCGPHAEPGWVNVDKSWMARISRWRPLVYGLARLGILNEQQQRTRWPREVVRRDLTKRFEWEERSVRAIYSSHMVEHLDRTQARGLLERCLRVLMPGGVLRLALPNLAAAVDQYQQSKAVGDVDAANQLIDFLYFVPAYASMSPLRQLGVRLLHRPHAWMYDSASMEALLKDVGFVEVRECRFREGECPDLQSLENRENDRFDASTFFIEGTKPNPAQGSGLRL